MINFLQSEDSLFVYSNYHDVRAIANMYNINVKVFSHQVPGQQDRWMTVSLDPEMKMDMEKRIDSGKVEDHSEDANIYSGEIKL